MLMRLGFHVKILILFALFIIYVGLELSLNMLLIDIYAQPVQDVLGEHKLTAERLELFGRTLSSFGLALAIISFLPPQLFSFFSENQESSGDTSNSPQKKLFKSLLLRSLVFFVFWILLIPSFRLLIDGFVGSTSDEKKLSAVRAITYKEAYLADAVSIEGFKAFNDIASDNDRKDLVVALVPSLAYFSTGFNRLLESNVENMADVFMKNRQKGSFSLEAVPRIRAFDSLYKKELSIYEKTNKIYVEAKLKENNYELIDRERIALINEANLRITNQWKVYAEELLNAESYKEEYAKNTQIQITFREYRNASRKNCNSSCVKANKQAFAQYLNNLTFEGGKSFGVNLTSDDIDFSKLFKSDINLRVMFTKGRKKYLHSTFGIPEEMEYEQYNQSPSAASVALNYFKKQNLVLADDWTIHDTNGLRQAIAQKYQTRAKVIWDEYTNDSQFDVKLPGLDRVDFARQEVVSATAKKMLGNYYLPSFNPGIAESKFQVLWLKSQDNISFIKMVTSTAATAAFSPGGSMVKLGEDAVKLAVIPPVSIIASLVAIFLLFGKFCWYLAAKSKAYFVIVLATGIIFLGLPTYNSVMDDNSYNRMMSGFATDFNSTDPLDSALTSAFGYVLDFENGIFESYRDLDFIAEVARVIRVKSIEADGSSTELVPTQGLAILRQYDNLIHQTFSFVPKILGFGEVKEPFNANITLLKKDLNVGAYLGVRLKNQKVESVSMPNFMRGTDIGLLAEQRFFYNPDWSSLVQDYYSNMDDPSYWLEVVQGDIAKESVMTKLESNMAVYLNQNASTLALLNQLHKKGSANLILLELEGNSKYRCFVMGTVTAQMISDSIKANRFDYQELPKCQATL